MNSQTTTPALANDEYIVSTKAISHPTTTTLLYKSHPFTSAPSSSLFSPPFFLPITPNPSPTNVVPVPITQGLRRFNVCYRLHPRHIFLHPPRHCRNIPRRLLWHLSTTKTPSSPSLSPSPKTLVLFLEPEPFSASFEITTAVDSHVKNFSVSLSLALLTVRRET